MNEHIKENPAKDKLSNFFVLKKVVDIEDENGKKFPVLLKKLNSGQNKKMQKSYQKKLEEMKSYYFDLLEKSLTREIKGTTDDQLKQMILNMEKPFIYSVIDLFPLKKDFEEKYREDNKDKSEEDITAELKKIKLESGTEDFIKRRTKELSEETRPRLEGIYISESINAKAVGDAVDYQILYGLTLMCLDPETEIPLYSMNEESPNYIDNLQDETLDSLQAETNDFTAIKNDKDVREVSGDSDLSPTTA